jgi:hypothetical protein
MPLQGRREALRRDMLSKKMMTRKPSILKATFGQFVGFWFFWIQKIAHY